MTSESKFDEFVNSQKQNSRPDSVARLEQWRQDLKGLYEQVQGFLKKYVDKEQITCSFKEIEINEEYLGAYKIKSLSIQIGPKTITLTPIGAGVIGARGRVDLAGPAGKARLVLVGKEATGPNTGEQRIVDCKPKDLDYVASQKEPEQWAWKFATHPPRIEYLELNAKSLYQAIMEVANG
ncbi:MAG: hypothetical protein GX589_00365 [Deltaproteobacteria bacterium]|nr:hypothetical protein [Deltaproteobacteria bacterium]